MENGQKIKVKYQRSIDNMENGQKIKVTLFSQDCQNVSRCGIHESHYLFYSSNKSSDKLPYRVLVQGIPNPLDMDVTWPK